MLRRSTLADPPKETSQIRRLFAHRFVHVRPPGPCELDRFYRAPTLGLDRGNRRVRLPAAPPVFYYSSDVASRYVHLLRETIGRHETQN